MAAQWKSSYGRPLIGSEIIGDSEPGDGHGEPCMGVSFSTILPKHELEAALVSALTLMRFKSPILAAAIETDASGKRVWSYNPLENTQQAIHWAGETLIIRQTDDDDDKIISSIHQTKLPYILSGNLKQYFALHLILRTSGIHTLLIHGTHSIFDAQPTLWALKSIFDHISTPQDPRALSALPWGSEWINLPIDIVTGSGGPGKVSTYDVPAQLLRVGRDGELAVGYHPQRSSVQDPGRPVRVRQRIDAETLKKMRATLKPLGLSVTNLFEAAQVLANFLYTAETQPLDENSYALLDMSVMSLQQYFLPPYSKQTHLTSALTYVSIAVPWADISHIESTREKLLAVTKMIKEQYDFYKANPDLRLFATLSSSVPKPPYNPYSNFITNLGVVENSLPTSWPYKAESPICLIHEVVVGHRIVNFYRPATHIWTIHSEAVFQIQSADIYDAEYLDSILTRILKTASLIL